MESIAATDGFHAYAVMALVVLALALFASERVPLATSSLLVLVLLTLLFELFPFRGPQRAGTRNAPVPRFRPSGAGRGLRADDCRAGAGAHRRAGTDRSPAGALVAASAAADLSRHAGDRRDAERIRQ